MVIDSPFSFLSWFYNLDDRKKHDLPVPISGPAVRPKGSRKSSDRSLLQEAAEWLGQSYSINQLAQAL